MIPDAGTQQQEEQQGLAQCYWEWVNDPVAQREYREWELRVKHAAWIADYNAALPLNEQEQEHAMRFAEMGTSKFLKKEDFPEPALLIIDRFERQNVAQEGEPDENKWVVYFKGNDKGLVLNSTNRAILERTFGEDSDNAVGGQIVIYVDENISFGGKLVGGLRLRAPKTKPGAAKPAPKPDPRQDISSDAAGGESGDDIPF